MDDKAFARHAVSLMDLTDLSDECRVENVEALAARALALPVSVAALCIWPRFLIHMRQHLTGSPIQLATVVNFPHGEEAIATVCEDTLQAVDQGADDIDLVLPWRACLEGRMRDAARMIAAVRQACGTKHLKVILETGKLQSEAHIREASRLALAEGADFLKTSTGKTPISATPEAAKFMLEEIHASRQNAGFKASGGLRKMEQARIYFDLAEEIMGAGWARPNHFRYGASALLDDVLTYF